MYDPCLGHGADQWETENNRSKGWLKIPVENSQLHTEGTEPWCSKSPPPRADNSAFLSYSINGPLFFGHRTSVPTLQCWKMYLTAFCSTLLFKLFKGIITWPKRTSLTKTLTYRMHCFCHGPWNELQVIHYINNYTKFPVLRDMHRLAPDKTGSHTRPYNKKQRPEREVCGWWAQVVRRW